MLNNRQLKAKAFRYARSAAGQWCSTGTVDGDLNRLEGLIGAAYFNGHRSAEALAKKRSEGEAWKKRHGKP